MSKHNFDIEKLKQRDPIDQREWNNLYSKLKGMLQSKSFINQKEFSEDVYQEMIIILREKMPTLNTTKDIINLAYAIYRIHLLEYNRVNLKFANKQYIQTEEGFSELTPDHIGSDRNEQEAQHDEEQLQVDLDALKRKFEQIKLRANKGNQILDIDLYNFYLAYTSESSILIPDLCDQYKISNATHLHNLNKWVQKELGLDKPLKKCPQPLEERKEKIRKNQRAYNKKAKEKKEQEEQLKKEQE